MCKPNKALIPQVLWVVIFTEEVEIEVRHLADRPLSLLTDWGASRRYFLLPKFWEEKLELSGSVLQGEMEREGDWRYSPGAQCLSSMKL